MTIILYCSSVAVGPSFWSSTQLCASYVNADNENDNEDDNSDDNNNNNKENNKDNNEDHIADQEQHWTRKFLQFNRDVNADNENDNEDDNNDDNNNKNKTNNDRTAGREQCWSGKFL